jgi:uncharacterized Zn finger protein
MSEIETIFRHCPACGRRFEIRLVRKETVSDRKETTDVKTIVAPPGAPAVPMHGAAAFSSMASPLVVEEDVPVTVEITEFQYTYRCKHCGHQWAELRTTQQRD